MSGLRGVFWLATLSVASGLGCSGDFDTSRSTPPRGTLGRELYSLVCDRVGAQALREDVTGASYHGICHPDPVTGAYATNVDVSLLNPLDPNAVDVDGNPVPLATQQANRDHDVARIEALGRTREPLVSALDEGIPDVPVSDTCNPDANGQTLTLRQPLQEALGRLTNLYNDRTIPLLTESLGRVLDKVTASPDIQTALAKMDARQGYRPSDVAIGVASPILAYPRLVDFANSLLSLVAADSQPYATGFDPTVPANPNRTPIPGAAHAQFQELLTVLHQELRTSQADPALAPLQVAYDSNDPTRPIYARPLGDLEYARALLFAPFTTSTFDASTQPLVLRDTRGVAIVPLVNGAIPLPFTDVTGAANGGPDGFADIDALGQYVTADGSRPTSPFFSLDGEDGPRNVYGLATNAKASNGPMYSAIDTRATMLAKFTHDLVPLLDPTSKEPIVNGLVGGLPIVFGSHDVNPSSTKTYAPDPDLPAQWALAHPNTPPPANLGTSPVTLKYAAYHAEDSPLVDLIYAVGQVLADSTTDDTLSLFRQLVTQHPNELARLVGVGLQIKAIADAHPEAHIPMQSTLWDELLDVFGQIADVYDPTTGGILEDLINAFGTDQTVSLKDAFTAYIDFRDQLTYQNATNSGSSADLNGPLYDLTTSAITPLQTPVDRTQADTGNNRSALQKFMQLLHDANGLGACTKAGAVAHLNFPVIGAVNYPTDFAVKAACATFGGGNIPPDTMPECGILRIPNVAQLLLDVALGRAQFQIADPCLNALLGNTAITGLVGGADAFLESQSGINGFDLHPTVAGIGRLVYYDTPHDSDPGDPSFPTTENFISGVIDPVPSMACDLAPPVTDPTAPAYGIPLRTCSSFDLTLRGRDNGSLFPLEQFNFITNIGPLAASFDDHGKPMLFVSLFDTLHLHWGSTQQSKAECDPTQPKTSALWCSQDGAVTYEPLLSEALKTDLFAALRDIVPIIKATTVNHCVTQDPTTGQCTQTTAYDGVHVLSEAVRALVDPARAAAVGLVDRNGNKTYVRNDGTTNPQVTPMDLLIDALKGIDSAWSAEIAAANGDTTRHDAWHDARSELVDTFFTVNGTGASSTFANPLFTTLAPVLIDSIRGDLAAHCQTARMDGTCDWARNQLTQELTNIVDGPTFASVIDLVDAIRSNTAARQELESLLTYLLGSTDATAQQATITAVHDVLQVFEDDANVTPLLHAMAMGADATLVGDQNQVVARSTLDALVEVLARVLAKDVDATGAEQCDKEIDPDHTLAKVIAALVTPTATNAPAPIEVIIDAISDVNRAHPEVDFTTKLASTDYASITSEVSSFFEDKASGLEQVYEVIREATVN